MHGNPREQIKKKKTKKYIKINININININNFFLLYVKL